MASENKDTKADEGGDDPDEQEGTEGADDYGK
jgi:hypothetical protein